jgi:hypothetical protein
MLLTSLWYVSRALCAHLCARERTTGRYLRRAWFEHLDHAQVFDFETTRRVVVKAIGAYSAKGRTVPALASHGGMYSDAY